MLGLCFCNNRLFIARRKIFILLVFCFFVFSSPSYLLAEEKVDINTASLEELDKITGIGPALAQRIVDARPFNSVDELIKVKGIGEKTLQKIKDQGLACVCSTEVRSGEKDIEKKPEDSALLTDQAAEEPKKEAELVRASYPKGVFINEILPSPEGADETNEWVELYNSNDFAVDLSGWKIKDKEGTTAAYSFPEKTIIESYGYLVLKRPETKITLNNTEDGLDILWPTKEVADSASYKEAENKKSYNRTDSGWAWSSTLTPGSKNIIQAGLETLPEPNGEGLIENITANLSSNLKDDENLESKNPWFLFLTVLAAAIICAFLILLVKLKFRARDSE